MATVLRIGCDIRQVVVRGIMIATVWVFLSAPLAGQQPVGQDQTVPAPPPAQTTQPPAGRPLNPAQEVTGEQAEGQALDIGPARLRVSGYLGVTGIYRSTNSGGGPGTSFGAIPYEDTLQGNVSETRISAQSSRISIRVDAPFPEARFRNLAGYFEMDFNGSAPGNIAVTGSSAGVRLRQAFAEVRYGESVLLAAGQAFSLMTPSKQQLSIWPSDYELSQAVDTNYVAGLVWGRVPQVRITWRPTPMFSWAVSVENPEQQIGAGLVALPACCGGDIAEQYNTGTQGLAVPNLMPDVVSRVAYNPTPWLHLDAGGVLRAFRHTVAPYDTDVKAVGGGVSVNVHANPTPTTRLIGQLASGHGLGRYVGGLAPDVAFRPDGTIAPIPTTSWVAGIEQAVTPRVAAAGYYSGVSSDATYFTDTTGQSIGFGFPGAGTAANRRIVEATGTLSYLAVRTENRGSAQVNLQTSWMRRESWAAGAGPRSADAWLVFVQLRYNLP